MLTDRAAESELYSDKMPMEYIREEPSSRTSSNNIFERLYKESEVKNMKREILGRNSSQTNTRAHSSRKRASSRASQKSTDPFGHLKIEDKLMCKHVHSLLRIDQMRKEKLSQE